MVEAMPSTNALLRAKEGEWSWDQYAAHLRSVWGSQGNSGSMAPGQMGVWSGPFARRPHDVVRDGDTLCCACARGGPCHLQIVAEFAHAQGWRVVLWGAEWPKPKPRQMVLL